ncbi:MAG: lysophospholipid acyltransferase family protein [Verrucomicrobiota bacterium]|nr:lysophospholipid acyltransferase family protein [Verrucomicrobiota bacterium]
MSFLLAARKLTRFAGICRAATKEARQLADASLLARAQWSNRWGLEIMDCLDLSSRVYAEPPKHGLLVCNHLSYLDVLVLAAAQPLVFVCKEEVRSWPVIGTLTRGGGTIYINRQQKSDVSRVTEAFKTVIEAGVVCCVFPEGTSSDGSSVLPFRSSLFQSAVEHDWPVTPAWLGYKMPEGSVEQDVCYWGDMTFGPHFLKLLSRSRISATLAYGQPLQGIGCRKKLSLLSRNQVIGLKDQYAGAAISTENSMSETQLESLSTWPQGAFLSQIDKTA